MTVKQKLVFAVLLFAAWGACVICDRTQLPGFVSAIRDALMALGVFTVALSDPKA